MKIVVTGSIGFIGFHLCKRLLDFGYQVIGLDNHNHYYDVNLKEKRLELLHSYKAYTHIRADIANGEFIDYLFRLESPEVVVNLAAQAGVRHSISDPGEYLRSNLLGFLNVLEACKKTGVKHLLYASSSSVYGDNASYPLSEKAPTDGPRSFYAATKKSNEVMAFSYSSLFKLKTSGFRFFTVYGPWGRPDMAMYKFAEGIQAGAEIELYNDGNHSRDFTFVDDVVAALHNSIRKSTTEFDSDEERSLTVPAKIYNIGSGYPVDLNEVLQILEEKIGKKARVKLVPMQPGDVQITHSDTREAKEELGFSAEVGIEEGIGRFVDWFLDYRGFRKKVNFA